MSTSDTSNEISAVYTYTDPKGVPVYQVLRTRSKGFFQRRRMADGSWEWGLEGVSPLPYRLAELLKIPRTTTIYICEGEKDVDLLWSLGLPATCNNGGAGKWRDDYTHYFYQRRIIILPDNDSPGLEHAAKVYYTLKDAVDAIKIVFLPDLPEKGDVSDWIDAGGTPERLEQIARDAEPWVPSIQQRRTKSIDKVPIFGMVNIYEAGIKKIKELLDAREYCQKIGLTYSKVSDKYSRSLCPFHKEKTPSFTVFQDRWVCFGCGEYGDLIDFYVKTGHATWYQAFCELAEAAGMDIPKAPPPLDYFPR